MAGGRESWLNCSTGGFTNDVCPGFIPTSAADFPRTINAYVIGENGPGEWGGYAFAPGSSGNPNYGHIGLTYTTFSTGAAARQCVRLRGPGRESDTWWRRARVLFCYSLPFPPPTACS